MRAYTRTFLASSAVAAAALGAVAASAGLSSAGESADVPPPVVEDFSYPGAEQILANRGILLVSGDGHIQLIACGQAGLIEVRASGTNDHDPDPGHYCFQATGPTGVLKLKLDNAYQVKGDGHAVQATIQVQGQTSTVAVDRNGWTGIGYGAGGNHPATLLELRATP